MQIEGQGELNLHANIFLLVPFPYRVPLGMGLPTGGISGSKVAYSMTDQGVVNVFKVESYEFGLFVFLLW